MPSFDSTVAIVVVDLQNDFADPTGGLAVPAGVEIIPKVNLAVHDAVDHGAMVIVTQDWHPPSTPHFAKDGGIWPVHCVADTWGSELHPSFELPSGAPRVRKGVNGEDGYSGFRTRDPVTGDERSTELESLLRSARIEHVVVCGLATDYCVKATALDARALGFEVTVLEGATAAVNLDPLDGRHALEEMVAAGVSRG